MRVNAAKMVNEYLAKNIIDWDKEYRKKGLAAPPN